MSRRYGQQRDDGRCKSSAEAVTVPPMRSVKFRYKDNILKE